MDKFSTTYSDFADYPNIEMDLNYINYINERFQSNSFSFQNYQLDNNEINRICEYLENPTKKGVWFFNFDWIEEGGITSYIENEIEDFVRNDSIQYSSVNNKKIVLQEKLVDLFLGKKKYFWDLQIIFRLFSAFLPIFIWKR